ncbi:hypothetical protein K432DRAFT_403146 [Lepidopterella palustris CBS 459.81]|uniref:Uncharacterized protein n=1 Tax=Lepidopterella palustris CBS 459.81 TaxID=1314670 RepID=A0A8E2EE98_9PEZI|nr:hypothetical protein K432DRAFT_403146 [Lepidopterella palustris CBS 459.81]
MPKDSPPTSPSPTSSPSAALSNTTALHHLLSRKLMYTRTENKSNLLFLFFSIAVHTSIPFIIDAILHKQGFAINRPQQVLTWTVRPACCTFNRHYRLHTPPVDGDRH